MNFLKVGAAFFLGIVLLVGCASFGGSVSVSSNEKKSYKHGPPPHAPANGYRYKHRDGVELIFDSRLGAYSVAGLNDTYFQNELFMRLSSKGEWEVAAHFSGPWRLAADGEVPSKLKKYKKHPGKGKGKKN